MIQERMQRKNSGVFIGVHRDDVLSFCLAQVYFNLFCYF